MNPPDDVPAPTHELRGDLRDRHVVHPVLASTVVFSGKIWDVVQDRVDLGAAGQVTRDYIRHTGAVAVLAMDDDERVLLLSQYRHPARHVLWEIPAGLLDVAGEQPHAAAVRELAEEADLVAAQWHVLVDWFSSPGASSEAIRCFLARGLSDVPPDQRHTRTGEERDMVPVWVPLDEARDAILAGRLHNPSALTGVLAACASRDGGWATLRPPDAPWPEHPAFR